MCFSKTKKTNETKPIMVYNRYIYFTNFSLCFSFMTIKNNDS